MNSNLRLVFIGLVGAALVGIGALVVFGRGSDGDNSVGGDPTTPTELEGTTTPDEQTTTPDAEDTLNAITVEVDGGFIVFTGDVGCVVGPGVAGSITGTADDGTTFSAELDGEASTVAIAGPSGTYNAAVTNINNNPIIMTMLAEPPEMEISVALAFCEEPS